MVCARLESLAIEGEDLEGLCMGVAEVLVGEDGHLESLSPAQPPNRVHGSEEEEGPDEAQLESLVLVLGLSLEDFDVVVRGVVEDVNLVLVRPEITEALNLLAFAAREFVQVEESLFQLREDLLCLVPVLHEAGEARLHAHLASNVHPHLDGLHKRGSGEDNYHLGAAHHMEAEGELLAVVERIRRHEGAVSLWHGNGEIGRDIANNALCARRSNV
mmetsp:Transcript_7510/g.31788  ORF Transcript_7510/g.31788 Transcript_7510/m.31788 type:complete len:216 (-) Transcript_7510:225-872(-)